MKCINCQKNCERDYCTKECKWTHRRRLDDMIPVIANRDRNSPREQKIVNDYARKHKKELLCTT